MWKIEKMAGKWERYMFVVIFPVHSGIKMNKSTQKVMLFWIIFLPFHWRSRLGQDIFGLQPVILNPNLKRQKLFIRIFENAKRCSSDLRFKGCLLSYITLKLSFNNRAINTKRIILRNRTSTRYFNKHRYMQNDLR